MIKMVQNKLKGAHRGLKMHAGGRKNGCQWSGARNRVVGLVSGQA